MYINCIQWKLPLNMYRPACFSDKLPYSGSSSSSQPLGQFGQEPEPSQAISMALVHCILGKFLGVV